MRDIHASIQQTCALLEAHEHTTLLQGSLKSSKEKLVVSYGAMVKLLNPCAGSPLPTGFYRRCCVPMENKIASGFI